MARPAFENHDQSLRTNRVTLALLYSLVPLALVILTHFYVQHEEAKLVERFRSNTRVESELNAMLSNVKDAETGQRGYLLTSQENYLEPYRGAVRVNDTLLSRLEQSLSENPASVGQLRKLRRLSDDKLSELAHTIRLSRSGRRAEAIEVVNTDLGKLKMDSIRSVVADLRRAERQRLYDNADDIARLHRSSQAIMVVSAVLVVGIFVYIITIVRPLFTGLERRNAEIVAQQELIESKNEELEHFAYITSHDLKEPSRTISGFVTALSEDYGNRLDSQGKEYLDFLRQAAQRMNDMVSSILSFSRLGQSESLIEKTDLNDLLRWAQDDLKRLREETGAVIHSTSLPTLPVRADLIKLLFQNLINNAIKFRRPGVPPEVRIAARETPEHWEISVTDNGIGIAPEQQHKIFRFFTKLHLASEYEGQGIGLAFCKRIVELHGGRINVRSLPEEGASFIFTLAKDPPHGAKEAG